MLLAKQERMTRRGAERQRSSRRETTARSEGVKPGTLDVGGVREKREDAFVAVARECVKVKAGAVDGSLVDFEVAGVDDDAERSADRKRDAIDRAVRDGNKFDLEWVNFDEAARRDFAERRGIKQASFFETLFDEREGEARAEHGHVDIAKNVGKCADVVFVAVRQDDRFDQMAILFEIGDVGNDEVDTEEFGFGEHHSGVDDDNGVADAKRHHIHAEFAETAERNCCYGLLGITQDAYMLRSIEEESYHRAAHEAFGCASLGGFDRSNVLRKAAAGKRFQFPERWAEDGECMT